MAASTLFKTRPEPGELRQITISRTTEVCQRHQLPTNRLNHRADNHACPAEAATICISRCIMVSQGSTCLWEAAHPYRANYMARSAKWPMGLRSDTISKSSGVTLLSPPGTAPAAVMLNCNSSALQEPRTKGKTYVSLASCLSTCFQQEKHARHIRIYTKHKYTFGQTPLATCLAIMLKVTQRTFEGAL